MDLDKIARQDRLGYANPEVTLQLIAEIRRLLEKLKNENERLS